MQRDDVFKVVLSLFVASLLIGIVTSHGQKITGYVIYSESQPAQAVQEAATMPLGETTVTIPANFQGFSYQVLPSFHESLAYNAQTEYEALLRHAKEIVQECNDAGKAVSCIQGKMGRHDNLDWKLGSCEGGADQGPLFRFCVESPGRVLETIGAAAGLRPVQYKFALEVPGSADFPTEIILPVVKTVPVLPPTQPEPAEATQTTPVTPQQVPITKASSEIVWPTSPNFRRITTQFLTSPAGGSELCRNGAGGCHWGIDIAANYGAPVYAIKSGTVVGLVEGCKDYVNDRCGKGGYGNLIVLRHDDGSYSGYGHIRNGGISPEIKQGKHVSIGQKIAEVGSTGHSTGPHIHFVIGTGGTADLAGGGSNPIDACRVYGC